MAEEKQILDALKIFLENGYCLGNHEITQILDIIGLRGVFAQQMQEGIIHRKGSTLAEQIGEENMPFVEFIFFMAKLFSIDLHLI